MLVFPSVRLHKVAVMRNRLLCLLSCVASLLLAGCGSAEYEKRLQASVGIVSGRAKFGDLDFRPVPFFDLPLEIRVPRSFTKPRDNLRGKFVALKGLPQFNTSVIENADQLQPSMVKLPGILMCFQALCQNTRSQDSRDLPYAMHIAAANVGNAADEVTADKVRDDLRASCAEYHKSTPINWENRDISTIDDRIVKWRHLRAEGPGVINYFGQGETKDTMVVDVFTQRLGEFRIFIAWVVPKSAVNDPNVLLDRRSALVAGTLEMVKSGAASGTGAGATEAKRD